MRVSVICSLAVACSLLIPALRAADEPQAASSPAKGPAIDLSQFRMTFSDEFDGTELDTSKWEAPEMPRQGASRWVKSLVSVHDGELHLGIRLTDDPVLRYDCGAVRTQRNYDPNQTMFQQRYGYYETRCKQPKHLAADYFADFWLMCGSVGDKTPDTRNGLEVDVFESFHLARKKAMSMSFHWNGYGALHNVAGFEGRETPQLLDGEFHTYGMYWDEKIYALFIDGFEVGRTDLIGLGSDKNGKTKSQGPCQKPGYLKLTVEAAPWAGATNTWEKELPKEDDFVIDYVRVYEGKLPEAAGGTAAKK
jgi:hypothetical protein